MCNHAMDIRNRMWLALPHLPVIPLVFLRLSYKSGCKSGLARLKIWPPPYSSDACLRRFHCMIYTLDHPDISILHIVFQAECLTLNRRTMLQFCCHAHGTTNPPRWGPSTRPIPGWDKWSILFFFCITGQSCQLSAQTRGIVDKGPT